jgi:hypothetical protein
MHGATIEIKKRTAQCLLYGVVSGSFPTEAKVFLSSKEYV